MTNKIITKSYFENDWPPTTSIPEDIRTKFNMLVSGIGAYVEYETLGANYQEVGRVANIYGLNEERAYELLSLFGIIKRNGKWFNGLSNFGYVLTYSFTGTNDYNGEEPTTEDFLEADLNTLSSLDPGDFLEAEDLCHLEIKVTKDIVTPRGYPFFNDFFALVNNLLIE